MPPTRDTKSRQSEAIASSNTNLPGANDIF